MTQSPLMKPVKFLALCLAVIGLLELFLNARAGFSNQLPNFFAPADEGQIYSLKPGKVQYRHRGRLITVTVDDNGNRVTPDQTNGTAPRQRVALIGDSQIFGWGLDDSETIAAKLQGLLGGGYDVVNLGLPGTGPWRYSALAAQEGPDTILITAYTEVNDGQDSYTQDSYASVNCATLVVPGGPADGLPCWMMETALFSFIVDIKNTVAPYYLAPPLNCNPLAKSAGAIIRSRINNLGLHSGTHPKGINITIPWDARINPDRLANYRPLLNRVACNWDFPSDIDLASAMASAENQTALFQKDDQHLSPAGADLVARLLAERILGRFPAPQEEGGQAE